MREIVKNEVNRSVIAYETRIGAPRHAENQKLITQIATGITVLKWMGSTALAILTVYVAWHRR